MIRCCECSEPFDEEENIIDECPYCGEYCDDVCQCPRCETLYEMSGDMWECPECENEGKSRDSLIDYDECPSCGAVMFGCVCEECGWPDVNQGWLGENY